MATEILVVEGRSHSPIAPLLSSHGYQPWTVPADGDVVSAAEAHQFDAVVAPIEVDASAPLALCEHLMRLRPDVPLVATGRGDLEAIVSALRSGVYDYVIDSQPTTNL